MYEVKCHGHHRHPVHLGPDPGLPGRAPGRGPTLALTAERALLLPVPVPRDVASRAARAAPWRARRRWPRPKEAAACAAPCRDGARAARADDEIEIRTLVSFHGKSGAQYILDITPLNEVRTGGKAAGQIIFMFLLPAGVVTGSSSCVTADTTPPAAGPQNRPLIVVLLSRPERIVPWQVPASPVVGPGPGKPHVVSSNSAGGGLAARRCSRCSRPAARTCSWRAGWCRPRPATWSARTASSPCARSRTCSPARTARRSPVRGPRMRQGTL